MITAIVGGLAGVGGVIGTLVQSRRTGQVERSAAAQSSAQMILDESAEYRAELRADLQALRTQLIEARADLGKARAELAEIHRENGMLRAEIASLRAALNRHGITE